MAIATGVEIEAGKGPGLSQGNLLATAQGTRLTGTAPRNPSSSTASAAESFRSGWQSLLASLVSTVGDAPQTRREASQASTVVDPARGESACIPSDSTSTKTARTDSRSGPETEKGSGKAGATEKPSTGGARTGRPTSRLSAGTIPATDSKTKSASTANSAHPVHVAAAAVLSTEWMSDAASGTIASVSPETAAPAIANTVSCAVHKLLQRTDANLPTETSGGFAPASFRRHSDDSENLTRDTKQANAGEQTTTGGFGIAARQGQSSTASGLSESFGPTSQVAMPAVDGNPPELPASGLNQREPVESGRIMPQTVMESHESTKTQTARQSSPPKLISGRDATGKAESSRDSIQTRLASGSPVETSLEGKTKASTPPPEQGESSSASIGSAVPGRLSVATDNAASRPGRLTVPAVADDPGYAGSGRASIHSRSRSSHGTGNFNSSQPENRFLGGQASNPAVDASAMARDVAHASGSVRVPVAPVEGSTASTTDPDSRDAFTTLDAAGTAGRPTWIHAGTRQAEAGFQDPALGWVGIRANASGGGVHAELVPGSADAAQALGSHLAGLNTYLVEHHTPVETLTLTTPESGWAGLGSDQGAGHGMQQGTEQQTGQELAQNTGGGSQFGEPRSPTTLPAVASASTASTSELDGSAQPAWLGGKHISVMA